MTMTTADYAFNVITTLSRDVLEAELESIDRQGFAAAAAQAEAEEANNPSLAMAHAADMGVLDYQYRLVNGAIDMDRFKTGEMDVVEFMSKALGVDIPTS